MALSANRKLEVRKAIHRAYSNHVEEIPWTKPELDDAITEADTWSLANKVAFNTALPLAYRQAATAADKAILLITCIAADYLADNPSKAAVIKDIINRLETA